MSDSNNPQVAVADSRAASSASNIYKFPTDDSVDNYSMTIELQKYSRGNPRVLPKPGPNSIKITLPLPMSGLQDNTNLQYDPVALGLVGGFLGTINNQQGKKEAFALAGSKFVAIATLNSLGDTTAAALNELGFAHMAKAASEFGNAAGAAFEQAAGIATNPNLSLSFQGVRLREHSFSWRLIAKSVADTNALNTIIGMLKRSALPTKIAGAALTLSYPAIAKLTFKPDGLIYISPFGCFIENINISYDGESQPAFFRDSNKPVIVDLSMTFKERAIVTAEDYGGESVAVQDLSDTNTMINDAVSQAEALQRRAAAAYAARQVVKRNNK